MDRFWRFLEDHAHPAGIRAQWVDRVGGIPLQGLVDAGVLAESGTSDTYPCPNPGGDGCPRRVYRGDDGALVAVCGNSPPDCSDVVLADGDLHELSVDSSSLVRVLHRVLRLSSRSELLDDPPNVWLVGNYIPTHGIRHPVFLVIRCSDQDYESCIDLLRARSGGRPFAVVTPTDRYLATGLENRCAADGILLVPLDGLVAMGGNNQIETRADPVDLFARIGRPASSTMETKQAIMAVALVRAPGKAPCWKNLDRGALDELVQAANGYDIFADEMNQVVAKGRGQDRKSTSSVPTSYFDEIRFALEKVGDYDPGAEGPHAEGEAGKQIFQRARQMFDLGTGRVRALFTTVFDSNHAVYRFAPNPDVSFALIFASKQ